MRDADFIWFGRYGLLHRARNDDFRSQGGLEITKKNSANTRITAQIAITL